MTLLLPLFSPSISLQGLYNYDPRNFVAAAWHVAHTCHYVEGIEGVQYYMNLTKAAAAKKAAKSAAAKKVE